MSYWSVWGLALIMALVLLLPFSVKRVEEELELFLLVMGCVAMTVSGLWNWHVIKESLAEPVKISVAVLVAGYLFRYGRGGIEGFIIRLERRLGVKHALFALITALAFLSSLLTAIIAALILCEIIYHLRLDRPSRVRAAVYGCFAIGLGAALTPLGEPLSTIVTAKLQGAPHNAGFFWLAELLFLWVAPAVIGVAALAAYWRPLGREAAAAPNADIPHETNKVLLLRAAKVYVFVVALVYLGEGLSPIAGRLIPALKTWQLYWLGVTSAALDNATLAAAGIVPSMSREQVLSFTLSLLISGGILIPGNIPNIISAAKLDIKSREWAGAALPAGVALLLIYFLALGAIY
ncbi:MAG: hypothetical protein A2X35_11580 [Elusimicrobia bacterium GWA2_61_42]|nr:MAG: hypothetical protein A2X35_11580 [Elusimicrobia bacterium GWA2_61_42]OGR75823.1 MAG: hypothetical protein A2X38_07335 [Elusimicrobia bacterium GWC2_61_25]